MTHFAPHRGFTLLIAVILASVALALALALLDVSYKQVTLALSAKQSQYALASADSAIECALYHDQKRDAFNYDAPLAGTSILCGTLPVGSYATAQSGGVRTTTFSVGCVGGGVSATVTVQKEADATTRIYANGYNTCNESDARRIERGLKVRY